MCEDSALNETPKIDGLPRPLPAARAIDPFHTMYDGDVLYAVTTNAIDPPPLKYNEISYIASEVAWDAVLRSF